MDTHINTTTITTPFLFASPILSPTFCVYLSHREPACIHNALYTVLFVIMSQGATDRRQPRSRPWPGNAPFLLHIYQIYLLVFPKIFFSFHKRLCQRTAMHRTLPSTWLVMVDSCHRSIYIAADPCVCMFSYHHLSLNLYSSIFFLNFIAECRIAHMLT